MKSRNVYYSSATITFDDACELIAYGRNGQVKQSGVVLYASASSAIEAEHYIGLRVLNSFGNESSAVEMRLPADRQSIDAIAEELRRLLEFIETRRTPSATTETAS